METEPRRRLPGRRDLILECFVRHVAERGYDGTNLGDIASELKISKGTIVHHFTSKDRMLAEAHAALDRAMWTIVCANLRNALELRGQVLGRAPAAEDVGRRAGEHEPV